jgi:hypothetical protein
MKDWTMQRRNSQDGLATTVVAGFTRTFSSSQPLNCLFFAREHTASYLGMATQKATNNISG